MFYVCASIHMFYLSFSFFSSPNFFPFLLSSLSLFLRSCILFFLVVYREIVHYVYFYFPLLIFFLHSNYLPSFHQLFCLFPSADFLILFSFTPYENDLYIIHLQFSFLFLADFECVGHFAYIAHFVFLRDVRIRTQRAAVASRRATNLATHLLYIAIAISNFPIIFSLLLFALIVTISSFPLPFASPFRFL